MLQEEGYIKFNCHWNKQPVNFPGKSIDKLNHWRSKLYQQQLIGAYPDGIGFGNISIRLNKENQFIVTGSATGQFAETGPEHYAQVDSFRIDTNEVWCTGQVKASSESLSHAIVYQTLPDVNAVVHIHNLKQWEKWKNVLPTTNETTAYGTPEMTVEISRLLSFPGNREKGILIMGGHREGILAFGKSLEEACGILLTLE
jgi:ribulose-5-phosphate 4-epimerase/fuculose-1-phosphate aldolase